MCVNITLIVLNKLEVELNITTCRTENIRIGTHLCIYSTLTYPNGAPLPQKLLLFNIFYYNDTILKDSDITTILTNNSGISVYIIEEIPDYINKIIVNVSYEGTEEISNVSSLKVIDILDKYKTNITLTEACEPDIRVGRNLKVYINLSSPEIGPLFDEEVQCTIVYIYETNLTVIIDQELTNKSGIAICEIEKIPDNVIGIEIDINFIGNNTIKSSTYSKIYFVEPKYNTSLKIFSQVPSEILVGDFIFIGANLTNLNLNQPIEGASIRLHIEFNDPSIESVHVYGTTEANGTTWANLKIPDRAANAESFSVILIYEGSDNIEGSMVISETEVKIITQEDLFLRNLPTLLLYIIIGVVSLLGVVLVYRIAVIRPRKIKKKKAIKNTYQHFLDVQNIQHFILLSKIAGGVLYSYSFGERRFEPDLIAGFLTAIAGFEDISKIKNQQKYQDQKKAGFVLSYADFIIFVADGNYIRIALILDTNPSDRLKEKAYEFIEHYESKYQNELINFNGLLKPFRKTNEDIEKIFGVSFLAPHRIGKITEKTEENLNKIEESYLSIAALIQKQKEYFSIPELIDATQDIRKDPIEETIYYFDLLRKKGAFKPIYIEKLEEIIENRRQKMEKEPKEWKIEVGEDIIPNIDGISRKKIKILNTYLKQTDPTYQKLVKFEVSQVKENKRSDYLNDLIQNWKNLTSQKVYNHSEVKKYKQNGDFYNAIIKLDEIRLINEELGFKEDSKEVIMEIKTLMSEVEEYNETIYKELQNRFIEQLNKCSNKAEMELAKNNPLLALQYYIACFNLSEQIGDPELIESYKKIMNDVRIQFNI